MDAFEDCPPEVRLRIVESIETREDVSALSLASPAIFQQCKVDRKRIIRTFVSRNLHGEHLDDALAVIFFPRCDTDSYGRKLYNDAHLKRWASSELSIPFDEMDVLLLLKLDSFCQRTWLFIDDFLSKATAPSLPEAYKMMPRVPAKSLRAGFSSDGLIWSWQRRKFDISKLTECERCKVFKSVVRYEMICNIYGPQRKEPANYPDGIPQCNTNAFRKIEVHLGHWKWSILDIYKKESSANVEHLENLASVREYIVSLYWGLISSNVELRHKPKIKYPEFENSPSLNPNDPVQDSKSDLLISLMASCGFDCLTSMLRLEPRYLKPFLGRFSKEAEERLYGRMQIGLFHPFKDYLWRVGPGTDEQAFYCDGFSRLLRQRASYVFEDDRFFPGAGRLPTVSEYEFACHQKDFKPFQGPDGVKQGPKGYQHIAYGDLFISLSQKLSPFWQ